MGPRNIPLPGQQVNGPVKNRGCATLFADNNSQALTFVEIRTEMAVRGAEVLVHTGSMILRSAVNLAKFAASRLGELG